MAMLLSDTAKAHFRTAPLTVLAVRGRA